jgi:NDP-sugar pyrophosphorylase family protein
MEKRIPILVILAIPRAYIDGSAQMGTALDVQISGKGLIEVNLKQYPTSFKKMIVVRRQDRERCADHDDIAYSISGKSQGALATLGLLLDQFESGVPIIVQPFDALVLEDLQPAIEKFLEEQCSVGLVTLRSSSTEYSYLRCDGQKVLEIAEKSVISDVALTGITFFANKEVLKKCLRWSLLHNLSTNGKFYVAPSLNALIANGEKVSQREIASKNYFRFTTKHEALENTSRIEERNGR